MTITREQVADLREGDVVEYSGHPDLRGAKLVGPLRDTGGKLLCIGDYVIRDAGGEPGQYCRDLLRLTVVSRAPRPLYVNHDRTEPVSGDVVRDDGIESYKPWIYSGAVWRNHAGAAFHRSAMPARLRLLVDGETGMVVQP